MLYTLLIVDLVSFIDSGAPFALPGRAGCYIYMVV